MKTRKRIRSFPGQIAKGAVKGLGKVGGSAVRGVVSELASILTLGLYRRPRKRR